MSLKINDLAPTFTLFNTEKKEISLADLKGKKVLLLFFPLAFTSTCTVELCSVRDNLAMYNSLNVTVFGISGDSLFSLGKFKEEQKLNFDLLSDFNKDVSIAYNTLYAQFGFGMLGVTKRSAYVINEEGKITYAEVLEDAGKIPDFDAIKKVL